MDANTLGNLTLKIHYNISKKINVNDILQHHN